MYPDQRVIQLITNEFIPVRSHIKEQPAVWGRFGVRWTPTVLWLDWRGREQHRIEGFLPTHEYLAQLELGLGYVAAGLKDWDKAATHFARVADEYADTDAGPAGLYWKGAARYSASKDPKELQATARAFKTRYTDSAWAMRSTVWKPSEPGAAAA